MQGERGTGKAAGGQTGYIMMQGERGTDKTAG